MSESDQQLGAARAFLEGVPLPRRGEGRLAQPRRLIEAGGISAVCLDVFDTLLWRRVPRPTDAFLLLGHQLVDAGELRSWVTPAAFRRLRIDAEQRARVAKWHGGGGAEATLEEIWAQIPPGVVADANPARLAAIELDLERRTTQPDLDVVELATFADEHGCQLALVSNTYFTNDQLARLLARSGMEVFHKALLFASCSFGVGKGDGLWEVVLSDLRVPAGRVVHVGDDVTADVETPRALGVRTFWYRRVDERTEEVLAREGLLPQLAQPPAPAIDPVEGDFGLTGLRAKVAARIDTVGLPADFAVAWRYGAAVLGPALTGFAEWVHDQAEAIGAETVWCVMREGELLSELVGNVAAHRGSGVRASPIWLSRQATARAALDQVNAGALREFLARRVPPTVRQFAAQLGLSSAEAAELPVSLDVSMDVPGVADTVIDFLVHHEFLSARILTAARRARQRLFRHLDRTIGRGEGPVVLVDLGWAGTIQHQLTKVFQAAGVCRWILGLYLLVNHVAADRILANREIVGYLGNVGEPWRDVAEIGRSPEVIEQSCLADTGSVVDFDEDGEPILDASVPPVEQTVSRLLVQDGVRAFQSEWLRYDGSVPGWPRLGGGERALLRNTLRASVSLPTRDEARVFGAWMHDDNFGADTREEINAERLVGFVPYLSPPDLAEMTMRDALWPLGLAAEHDRGLAQLAQLLQAETIAPLAFEMSAGGTHTGLAVDAGGGFGERQRRPLRVNRNGLSFAHFSVSQPGISQLSFIPCEQRAVFRIHRIDLELAVRSSAAPQRLRIEDPAELAGLVYSGCRWLSGGLAIATTEEPQVRIALAGRAHGIVDAVRIHVGFAVLHLPAGQDGGLPPADLVTRVSRGVVRVRTEAASGGLRAVGRGALRTLRRSLR